MRAIGDYVLISVPPTLVGAIQVRNDGFGICISAPNMADIEGKKVMFDSEQKYHEHEDMIIIHKNHLLLCLDDDTMERVE